MKKQYEGIFLFAEWLDALNGLPAKTAMEVINNLYRFETEDIEPPPMRGSAAIIQNIMLAYARRSKVSAEYGRKGAENRWKRPTTAVPAGRASAGTTAGASFGARPLDLDFDEREWEAKRIGVLRRIHDERMAKSAAQTENHS